MSISTTLQDCLRDKGSRYDVLHHRRTATNSETAEAAHIPGDRLAKTVLLGDTQGYVAAVLPSTYHLELSELWAKTGRHLELAKESDLSRLFRDCETGALPPVAMAYGMQTYLEESLTRQPDVYFEAGDHQDLIHMSMDQFLQLMERAESCRFAHRMQ